LGSVACSLEGEGGRAPGMAADVSDMMLSRVCVFPGCAFCVSVTLRLPVLGSMSPVVLSVSRDCRSSDELSGRVGLEVRVSMRGSWWRYCWLCPGGGSSWWGGDMAGRCLRGERLQGLDWQGKIAGLLSRVSVCHKVFQTMCDRTRRKCQEGRKIEDVNGRVRVLWSRHVVFHLSSSRLRYIQGLLCLIVLRLICRATFLLHTHHQTLCMSRLASSVQCNPFDQYNPCNPFDPSNTTASHKITGPQIPAP
jgi:hypothetical protein